ncbi:AAA family ATPase [Acanthopleuribacter pedis]|uniref:AAA family ATPase n=1 Tax=Acanthopleuribacter pedis TaxID=442870 RepID=A0A8J7QBQ8_9BACT|nr:AAA family ATPase [Acanthopleuribacter pedis]MBO1321522.1 AAA family ATPase [Acanthopleuribacter pedis]
MKILAIRGSNLTSLAGEFAVELQHPPLGQSGLFAITGPTGAGKSTLLDALCVSLYGRIPRLENTGAAVQIGNDAQNTLAHNDPRNLLRRGAAACHAETEYRGLDGKVYLARWEVERVSRGKNKGVLKPSETTLRDMAEDRLIGRTKTEVLQAVHETIGLTFDQFRRSVLLAQGDFAAFLKAGNKARADLLERMTGTEIYSRIGTLAYERAKREQQSLDILDTRLGEATILTEEQREEHETHLAETQEKRNLTTQQHQQTQQTYTWIKQHDRLQQNLEAATKSHQEQRQNLDDFQPQREKLQQATRVEALRPTRREYRELTQTSADLTKRLDDAVTALAELHDRLTAHTETCQSLQSLLETQQQVLKDKQPELEEARLRDLEIATHREKQQAHTKALEIAQQNVSALEKKQQTYLLERAQLEQEQQQLQQWLADHQDAQQLCNHWETWRLDLENLVENHRDKQELEQKQAQWQKEQHQFRQQIRTLESKRHTAQQELSQSEASYQDREQGFDPEARARMQHHIEQNLRVIHWLQQATKDQGNRQRLARRLQEKEEKYQHLITQGKQAATEAETAGAALQKNQIQLTEARETLDRLRLTHSQNLNQLRASLETGQPCPLCGATEHPYREQQPADHLLADQQNRVTTLEQQNRKAVQDEAAAKSRLAHLREQARGEQREAKKERQEAESEHEKWVQLWHTKPDDLPFHGSPETDETDLESALQETLADFERKQRRYRDDQGKLDTQAQEIEALRKQVEQHRRRFKTCDEERQTLAEQERTREQERIQQESRYQSLSQQIEASRTRLDPLMNWLPDWRTILEQDPPALLERCDARIATQKNKHDRERERTIALKNIDQALHPLAGELTAAQTRRDSIGKQHEEGAELLKQTLAHRATLLDGAAVTEVLERLESAVNETTQSLKQQQERVSQVQQEIASQEQRKNSLQEQIQTCRRKQEDNRARWQEQLAQAACSESEAETWLAIDREWCTATQNQLAGLEQACRDSEVLLRERREAVANHDAEQPEGELAQKTAAELADALALLEETKQQQEEAYYAVKNLLDQDQAAQTQRRELLEQRARQLQTVELWQAMRNLIGSKDGNKFRQYAQSLTLDALLGYANVHLEDLARRYRLARVPHVETLELQIIDGDMADEARSINSLSGGETFLVSLALALGLASMSAERSLVESLFIDEGFGALDPESLDLALSALDSLQAMGRQVGVISHIPTLIERIGTRINVIPQGAGRSFIRVEDAYTTA